MHHNVFGNDHAAQYNLTGLRHRLNLILRNLRWVFAVQRVGRNDNSVDRVTRRILCFQFYILK